MTTNEDVDFIIKELRRIQWNESDLPHEAANIIEEQQGKLDDVKELIEEFGSIDGAHHKQWVIDQILRVVIGNGAYNEYNEWVEEYEYGEDGPETYEWDTGVAP